MEIYTKKDLELFEQKIDLIEEELKEIEKNVLEPTYEEKRAVEKEILDYIKKFKRKIYGGFAQNKLISFRSPEDAFYEEGHVADLDFYSPEPIEDLIRLSNILHEKGYKYVQAQEAVHKETYSIFVNFNNACDISYVPKNVYHRIPFVEIDEINYVHPSFIMIDLYRMFTDPITSGTFRWKKTFPRLYLLQKHYPFNKATSMLPSITFTTGKESSEQISGDRRHREHKELLNYILNFIEKNDSIILFGRYAYNCFLEESQIMKDKKLGKKYKFIDIPYYEVISTNYRDDGLNLYNKLKSDFPDIAENINIVEYYPLWMLLGYSFTIYYHDQPIVNMVHYNYRCSPIKKISLRKFDNNKVTIDKNREVQISSFALTLLMSMIYTFKWRVNKDEARYQFQNIMTSHLVEIRNYYLEKNDKNMFDDTLFQEFIVKCIGEPVDPLREARIVRYRKAKMGKLVVFRYDPSTEKKEPVSTYKFANTSGNPIRNPRNFRIIEVDPKMLEPRTRDRTAEEEIIEDIEEEAEKIEE